MTTIQIRIDDETKISVKRILDELGLDMSTAIKMYLKQIVRNEGIPLDFVTENGMTLREELELLRISEEAEMGINVSEPMATWKEVKKHLDSLKKKKKKK
jgi:DNA-damage-inducible protein J